MSNSNHIEPPESHYEERDVNLRAILALAVGLAVLTIVALLGMWLMFNALEAREERLEPPRSPLADTRQPSSEPRLQVKPRQELNEMRDREDALLNSYDWVNKEAGVVRIPINRAIELLAEKGLPVRQQAEEGNEEMGK